MRASNAMELEMSTGAGDDREAVLSRHIGLVHQIVGSISGSVARARGSYDDLVSAGLVGLLAAYDAFDAARGVTFSTYAAPRIRGAVLDELRKQDFVPRSVRRKARDLGRARAAVSARSGRAARSADIASELGVPMSTVFKWEADAQLGVMDSLDAPDAEVLAFDIDRNAFMGEGAETDAALLREEEVAGMRAAISRLPEQERLVLILYFYEELKLRQIGELVGVSESRASQIRTRALARLREELQQVAA